MTRRSLSRQDFIEAGTSIVDEHGSSALTARALGEAMRVDASALYRHFTGLDELAAEIVDRIFLQILETPLPDGSPRERLAAHLRLAHRVMSDHPNLIGLIVSISGDTPHGDRLSRHAFALLREFGLEGANLMVAQQMLESAMVGTHLFDLAASPNHLEIRRQRRRRLEDPTVDEWSRSTDDVQHINDAAFELLLEAMLDRIEALVATPR